MVKIAISVIQSLTARPVVFLIVFSLLTHLTVFGLVYAVTEAKNLRFPYLTGDSNHYRLLAEHLLAKGAFDTYPDRPSPDSFRTPGYPLFLAALFAIGGSWKAAAFLQIVILSLIGVSVYFFGKEIFGKTFGLLAGVFVALDPVGLFYSTLTLSDGLFTLLFILSLLLFWRGMRGGSVLMFTPTPREPSAFQSTDEWSSKRKNISQAAPFWVWGFISGAILGFAVLVRPIGQFLPILYLAFLWFETSNRRVWARRGIVFLIGFSLIVFPWMLRNKLTFDSWQLSSVGNFNAGYFAMLFLQEKTGIPASQYEQMLVDEKAGGDLAVLRSMEGGPISLEFARDVIIRHPIEYTVFHAIKTMPFFLNDGLREIARLLNFSDRPLPNFSSFLLSGDFKSLVAAFKEGGVNTALLLLGSGGMSILIFLAAYGIWMGVKSSEYRAAVIFILLLILYFAVFTGPVANARYRMPAMPLLFISAVYGGRAILLALKRANQSSNA